MIIQGNKLALIDKEDTRWNLNPKKSLEFDLDMVEQKGPAAVLKWFKSHWVQFLANQGYKGSLQWVAQI
jgi:hypothetical protein